VIWVKKSGQPNHWWDCLVHARHAAEIIGVRWLDPTPRQTSQPAGKAIKRRPMRTKY